MNLYEISKIPAVAQYLDECDFIDRWLIADAFALFIRGSAVAKNITSYRYPNTELKVEILGFDVGYVHFELAIVERKYAILVGIIVENLGPSIFSQVEQWSSREY